MLARLRNGKPLEMGRLPKVETEYKHGQPKALTEQQRSKATHRQEPNISGTPPGVASSTATNKKE